MRVVCVFLFTSFVFTWSAFAQENQAEPTSSTEQNVPYQAIDPFPQRDFNPAIPRFLSLDAPTETEVKDQEKPGDGGWRVFRRRNYMSSLLADPMASDVRITFGLMPIFAYFSAYQKRCIKTSGSDQLCPSGILTLGTMIPIAAVESQDTTKFDFKPGEGGISLVIPVAFEMAWDLASNSNPIINTDYRFGIGFKGRVGILENLWLAYSVLPVYHESTHLGDEVSLYAQERYGHSSEEIAEFIQSGQKPPESTFARVNVSRTSFDTAVRLEYLLIPKDRCTENRIPSNEDRNTCNLFRFNFEAGWWYSYGGLYQAGYCESGTGDKTPFFESNGRTIYPSVRKTEARLGLETKWSRIDWFGRGTSIIASVFYAPRIKFDYTQKKREDLANSWNVFLGFEPSNLFHTIGVAGFHLRYYRGLNPIGQLRDTDDFWFVGLGLHTRL